MTSKKEMLEMLKKAIEDDSIDVRVIPISTDKETAAKLSSGQLPTVDDVLAIVDQLEKLDDRECSSSIAASIRKELLNNKDQQAFILESYLNMKNMLDEFKSAYKPTDAERAEFKDLSELCVYLSPPESREHLKGLLELSINTCPSKELWAEGIKKMNEFIDEVTKAFQTTTVN